MSKNKDKYVAIDNISRDGDLRLALKYKPRLAYFTCLAVGCLLCITLHWAAIVMGLFLICLAVFMELTVKDYQVMDIYENFLIVYDLENDKARRIEFDDIVEWTCKHGMTNADSVMIKLQDGEYIYKDSFLSNRAYRVLNKLMPKKESQIVKDKENAKSKLKFDIPFIKRKKSD